MDVQSLLARCMLESTNQSLLARLENVTFFFSGMCILLYIIVYYCIYIAGDCDEDGVEKRAPTGTRGLAEAQPFLPGSRWNLAGGAKGEEEQQHNDDCYANVTIN